MVVGGRELIDTLWNVNLFEKMEKIFAERGINRYIMECKSCSRGGFTQRQEKN